MRPLLLKLGSYSVASYSFFVALAVILAVITLAVRTRRRDIDQLTPILATGSALIAGWLGSRTLPVLFSSSWSTLDWKVLLPNRPYNQSLSGFLMAAFPVASACLWSRRRAIFVYFDVISPSLMLGVALAKVACLMGGCCSGRLCTPQWGIRYPYGSEVYQTQWKMRQITLPDHLIYVEESGNGRLLGHAYVVELYRDKPLAILAEHAQSHGLSYSELLDAVAAQRSLPVLPVPLWYTVSAAMLWIATEWIYRRTSIAGLTSGITFVGYGLLRLLLDRYVPLMPHGRFNLTDTQRLALPIIAIGAAILLLCLRRARANRAISEVYLDR